MIVFFIKIFLVGFISLLTAFFVKGCIVDPGGPRGFLEWMLFGMIASVMIGLSLFTFMIMFFPEEMLSITKFLIAIG